MALKIIHTKNLRWIDVINCTEGDLKYLKDNFNFHPLDFDDVLSTSQHTKVEERDGYHFIVLLFPVFNRTTREIRPSEIDFFIGENYVITVHDGSMYTMVNLFEQTHKHQAMRDEYMSRNSGMLLYKLLESLFRRSFPILDHITKDMTEIETKIFSDLSKMMLEKISLMKRNIIDFRRIMKTHHLILKKLIGKKNSYMVFPDSKNYYISLLEHAENIWDILAIQKETVEALQDANQSLAANQLNQITRMATIVSGVFFPATLIAFVFGISVDHMPLRTNPFGFWIVLGLMIFSSAMMLVYFKKKRLF